MNENEFVENKDKVDEIVKKIIDGKICVDNYEDTEKNVILMMQNTYKMFVNKIKENKELRKNILECDKSINLLQCKLDCLLNIVLGFLDKENNIKDK